MLGHAQPDNARMSQCSFSFSTAVFLAPVNNCNMVSLQKLPSTFTPAVRPHVHMRPHVSLMSKERVGVQPVVKFHWNIHIKFQNATLCYKKGALLILASVFLTRSSDSSCRHSFQYPFKVSPSLRQEDKRKWKLIFGRGSWGKLITKLCISSVYHTSWASPQTVRQEPSLSDTLELTKRKWQINNMLQN